MPSIESRLDRMEKRIGQVVCVYAATPPERRPRRPSGSPSPEGKVSGRYRVPVKPRQQGGGAGGTDVGNGPGGRERGLSAVVVRWAPYFLGGGG